MNVVLILPTYNERENIAPIIKQILQVCGEIHKHLITVLVVDDNSPDGTLEIVKKLAKDNPRLKYISGQKQGLGKALYRGMEYAVNKLKADIVAQMDADLSHDPKTLPDFIKKIDQGNDFIVGSRYITNGSIPENWGLKRKIYSILGNAVVRYGLGHIKVHDWTGGYRMFLKKYFELSKTTMDKHKGYVFQIAFLHKSLHHGANVAEVPIHFTDRRYGHSKIAPSEYIKDVFRYIMDSRIDELRKGNFGKFCVVGLIGFLINTIILEIMVKLKFEPWIGSITGAEMAIISNFILNNFWTFNDRKIHQNSLIFKFVQFNFTSLGAILIQSGTVFAGTFLFGNIYYRLFYILGVGIGLIWNYAMYSKVIWKKK